MAAIDDTIAKTKILNYVDNAKDIDELVLICQKFLEKYKPELVKPPMPPQKIPVSPNYNIDDPWLNRYESYKEQIISSIGTNTLSLNSPKVLTASILCDRNVPTEHKQKELSYYLGEQILKSGVIQYEELLDPMSFGTIIKARVGVHKL